MEGTVKYSEEFYAPSGLKRWIGIEMTYNQDTQDPLEVLAKVEKTVRDYAGGPYLNNDGLPPTLDLGNGPEPIQWGKPSSVEERIARLIEDINSCSEIKVLESYRLMVKANDQLQAAYDNRMKELTT